MSVCSLLGVKEKIYVSVCVPMILYVSIQMSIYLSILPSMDTQQQLKSLSEPQGSF